MDPVSILGVTAATIQFVDFGQRLFSETWQIYRSASGQTLQLHNLSAVSSDISKLSTTVKESFQIREQDTSPLEGPDEQLQRLCQECDDIAIDILAVIRKVGGQFERELATDKSVGECFRAALKSWWERDEITKIGDRLEKVHQEIMMAATISIWHNSQSTKNWEHQFSSKLDFMIEMLSQTLKKAERSGPEEKQRYKQNVIHHTAVESMRRNHVTDQIISRLWRADWKPDPRLLTSYPREASSSIEKINSYICNSLRFDTMDNREEAITKTFDRTFQWVFDRDPQVSSEGRNMWSSLPDWLEGDSGLPYWITGKPGSGKSTMMKFILQNPALYQHLQKWSQGRPLYTIKYYAWKPGAEKARSEDGLLRTLLHQILSANPKMIPCLCPRRWSLFHAVRQTDAFPPWTTWELDESFGRLLQLEEGGPLLALFIDGLDEFDVAPLDLCNRIQKVSSHKTIKVCVASRPWPQFSDAFAASPGLQMHLLTDADIQAFARGHFRGLKAFQELDDLYQGGGEMLLTELVTKAKGVFLWTALVTQTLLENLIDGSGLSQLQKDLETMPSEIENLYDAIYAAIPKRLLPEVSAMFQLYVIAFQAVDWMTLWLADEARNNPTATQTLIQYLDKEKAQAALQRRLGARTRGILEFVPRTETVEYLHRTAAEWMNQPDVWERILSVSPQNFDPHTCLLQAEVVKMQNSRERPRSLRQDSDDFCVDVAKALYHASQIDETLVSDTFLADLLDQFRDASLKLFATHDHTNQSRIAENISWVPYSATNSDAVKATTFDGLVTQFAILPYIRHKLDKDPIHFHPVRGGRSIALLEQAILGSRIYFRGKALDTLDMPNVSNFFNYQRLQVVELLLQKGVRQPGVLSLVETCRVRTKERNHQYLDDVEKLLKSYKATGDKKRYYIKRFFSLA